MARRLVERGVKFVEVVLDGWDTHQNDFDRTQKLMATLDPALRPRCSTTWASASACGSTLVACMGEFGRTPRINANDGRDHWPGAWSAVLAGGGITRRHRARRDRRRRREGRRARRRACPICSRRWPRSSASTRLTPRCRRSAAPSR